MRNTNKKLCVVSIISYTTKSTSKMLEKSLYEQELISSKGGGRYSENYF